MAQWQGRSRRKRTGGRYRPLRHKRKREIGREAIPALVDTEGNEHASYRSRGGGIKIGQIKIATINVTDKAKGRTFPAKVKSVIENPSDPNYVQRNIVTKGALVLTDKGKVKVTSRPGQNGALNGILVAE